MSMRPNDPGSVLQYDRIQFAGQYLSPGLCTIEGAALINKWDVRAGYGVIGGTAWFIGTELSEFSTTFYLYDDLDWADWDELAPQLRTRQRTPSWRGLDIEHPILREVGITACVVKRVHQPVPVDELGQWSIKVDFLDYPKRPQLKAAKLDAAQAEPEDPVEREIRLKRQGVEALEQRYKSLGQGG